MKLKQSEGSLRKQEPFCFSAVLRSEHDSGLDVLPCSDRLRAFRPFSCRLPLAFSTSLRIVILRHEESITSIEQMLPRNKRGLSKTIRVVVTEPVVRQKLKDLPALDWRDKNLSLGGYPPPAFMNKYHLSSICETVLTMKGREKVTNH